jgi:small subunit ribosomal protein S17
MVGKTKETKKEAGPKVASDRGLPKTREGVVTSDKMDKTITVAIVRQVKHSAYGKYIRKTNKYLVHDQKEECSIGDLVSIVETRPLSKNKRWKLEKIIRKAVQD